MAIEGSLQHFRLPEILQMISAQNKTGILTVQGENDIVAISFKEGHVVAADALNQTVEEGLGQVLASQGLVNPADFARVSAEHEAGSQRLLDLLVEHGYVDRQQLLDALRLQTYQLMLQLLRWDQGEFKFYSGDEVAYEEGFKAISIEELLIRSVTDLGDEGQGAALPNLDHAYEQSGGGTEIKLLSVDGEGPMDDQEALWLSEEEHNLYGRFDGTLTARAIAEQSGLGDYKVLYTLYRLLGAGAVRQIRQEEASELAAEATPLPAFDDVMGELPTPVTSESIPVEMPEPDVEFPEYDELVAGEPTPPRPASRLAVVVPAAIPRLVARLAAGIAGLMLFGGLLAGSGSFVLELPWLKGEAADLELNQRTALYRGIDRGARTFFLLEGHYPDELRELAYVGLVGDGLTRDPRGRMLAYSTGDVSYSIQPVERGEPLAELSTAETITGNFLLDPEFVHVADTSGQAPLVLLD